MKKILKPLLGISLLTTSLFATEYEFEKFCKNNVVDKEKEVCFEGKNRNDLIEFQKNFNKYYSEYKKDKILFFSKIRDKEFENLLRNGLVLYEFNNIINLHSQKLDNFNKFMEIVDGALEEPINKKELIFVNKIKLYEKYNNNVFEKEMKQSIVKMKFMEKYNTLNKNDLIKVFEEDKLINNKADRTKFQIILDHYYTNLIDNVIMKNHKQEDIEKEYKFSMIENFIMNIKLYLFHLFGFEFLKDDVFTFLIKDSIILKSPSYILLNNMMNDINKDIK